MPKKRKFSVKQLAAQKRFAAMARAGKFTKSRSKPTAKTAVSGGNTMPKRRKGRKGFSRFGRVSRSSFRRAAGTDMGRAVAGVAYGFTRPFVSRLVAPITNMLPVGGILADNIAIFGAAWIAKRFVREPLARQYLDAAMTAEAVLAGVDLSVHGFANLSPQAPKVSSTAVEEPLRSS